MIKANFHSDWTAYLKDSLESMGYSVKPSDTPDQISIAYFSSRSQAPA